MNVVAKIEQKSIIKYNQEEIEKGLLALEEKYTDLTFTEEQIKEAKEERAKLNKLKKTLDEYRKNILDEATKDIQPFETYMKEAAKRADKLSKSIDEQVKTFEKEQEIIRLSKVVDYIESIIEENPKYNDFREQLQPSETEKIFTNKGSFTSKGDVGSKIIDHIAAQLIQIDEVIEARRKENELKEQKKDLIHSTCVDMTELLELEIVLNPANFYHLIDKELTEIANFIKESAKKQKESEKEAVERIRKQEEEKLRNQEFVKKEVVEIKEEKVADIKEEYETAYNLSLKFKGLGVEKANLLMNFIKTNNIQFELISKEECK